MLRPALPFALLMLLFSTTSLAEEVRYVSEKQYIPLRSGAGNDYRIVHRGIPSGTKLVVARVSEDQAWSEIHTEDGTTGWMRSHYLVAEDPAGTGATLTAGNIPPPPAEGSPEALAEERDILLSQLSDNSTELDLITQELNNLKKISGTAEQLDLDNRKLVEETENLRSALDMQESENQRLEDRLESEDLLNGALAVLLGVIIALVVPRLVPKRRNNSSWS